MSILLIIITISFILIISLIFIYNKLIKLKNSAKKSWSTIDVMLKRRSELIPNLINAVKGYLKHERFLLNEVTKARTAIIQSKNNNNINQAAAAENYLEEVLSNIFMVAENYPKLKSNENFLSLQNELTRTEDEISSARRIYNNNVRDYNTKIEMIPFNIFASIFNFKRMDYFSSNKKNKEEIKNIY